MTKKENGSTKNIGPRISNDCWKWLETTFPSVTGGAKVVLEGTMTVYRRSLQELQGIFTADELKAMIDVMKGVNLPTFSTGKYLPSSIMDQITWEGLGERWHLDDDFVSRLSNCTSFQIACLEWWAAGFWCSGAYHEKSDTDEYIGFLARGHKEDN